MNIVVQKFGGTSVASRDKRKQVAKKVALAIKEGYRVVVVVSAMGRLGEAYATDTLLGLVGQQSSRHISNKDLDLLMACGEIISGVVMVSELKAEGYEATCLTGGQAGIVTDESFSDARIIMVKPGEVLKELEKVPIVIVAGFQGVTQGGRVTTLGRGGSDTTAAALGVALKAERIDIYTDVDGVKTADPRVVEEAKTLRNITYNEVCQLAHEGAKVIHPRAVEIAMQGNVPLRILNTFTDGDGTLVTNCAGQGESITDIKNDRLITGITHKPHVTQLTVHNDQKSDAVPVKIFQSLAAAKISVDFITITDEKIIFTVKDIDKDNAVSIIKNLDLELDIKPDCAKVAAVGAGMTGVPGVMAKIVEALTEAGIKILQSADSYTSIWCLVTQKDMEKAVRALHRKFQLG
ncbi:MAG: aspartate kinase [Desulfitobacteriaceae bacterium]|nr:aspartate kinase [Desulfitobacteriaceae bacterium]MDD4751789.1 aspartate kinase [Desulfitobacteriaceae bacterium]